MSVKRFDRVVKQEALRRELIGEWTRQRETAREFCRRFESGSDTQMLGDQVGMGKTYVAMAVMANTVLDRVHDGSKALLITPASAVLRSKWEQEIRSFSRSYLVPGSGALKPLVVKSYWDLVGNLHDHKNAPLERISEGKLSCILYSLWSWALKKGWVTNHQNMWPELGSFKPESAEAMQFVSDYSGPAWEAFLEKRNADGNDFLRGMLVPNGRLWKEPGASMHTVKNLFKKFAANQDTYEPNVFILGMNSLKRPKVNSAANQRFSTFVLAVLLKGRWKTTCEWVLKALKKKSGVLPPGVTMKQLNALGAVDLYRTRNCVMRALEVDDALTSTWQNIMGDPSHVAEKSVQKFFSELLERVVSLKLLESGIRLAVVDEVHNWKSGANGGKDFRKNFADTIEHKLLMSATPFQLAEGEMKSIFGYASKRGGPTSEVLERIYGGSGLVEKCLLANENFVDALAKLDADEAEMLSQLESEGLDACALKNRLSGAVAAPETPISISRLYKSALFYRATVDALLNEQRLILIRHMKDRKHRSFHAGRDFMSQGDPPHKTALYRVAGSSDQKSEFVNYLAMRLDQRIRAAASTKSAEEVNAHLVRGLSSSKSAFRQSSAKVRGLAVGLPPQALSYMKLFEEAIDLADHPKVSATVEHAFSNYRQGRKTLIFCERVPTVGEIAAAIRLRIDSELGEETPQLKAARDRVLEDHLFADIQLHRTWRRIAGNSPTLNVNDPSVRAQAVEFVRAGLIRGQALATRRRVLRLLDLWFLRSECRRIQRPSQALRLLSALADHLEGADDATDAYQKLLDARSEQVSGEEQVLQVIENVMEAGFWNGINLWVDSASTDFDSALWELIESEAFNMVPLDQEARPENLSSFYGVVLDLQKGLRKVALRPDLLRRCLVKAETTALAQAIYEGVRARGQGESPWSKIIRYVKGLGEANGTINALDRTNTSRRSLWRGVELKEDPVVATLDGSVEAERRVVLCAAFNSPLAPDVLVCTAIGSEGIDLHRECAEIIHHDLPWNPARLEQRIGRVDRVGRLAESSGGVVRVGIPFLAQNYEQFQYEKVLSRAQLFEVLLGKPDFDLSLDEEEYDDVESGKVREVDCDEGATSSRALPVLPQCMVEWLRVDLSLNSGERQA